MTTRREELLSFLTTAKANVHCEICGKNDWTVPEDPQLSLRLSIQDMDQDGVNLGGPYVPADSMFCNNCGNIRLFAFNLIHPNHRPKVGR